MYAYQKYNLYYCNQVFVGLQLPCEPVALYYSIVKTVYFCLDTA